VLARAIAHTHRQILPAPFAVGSAGGSLAAKSGEIVHDQSSNFPLLGSLLVALGAVMADIARMFNHNRPPTNFRLIVQRLFNLIWLNVVFDSEFIDNISEPDNTVDCHATL